MADTITNEQYEDAMKLIATRDKELALEANGAITTYEEALKTAIEAIKSFQDSLPATDFNNRTQARSIVDSALGQILSSASQVTYAKQSLSQFTTPSTVTTPTA